MSNDVSSVELISLLLGAAEDAVRAQAEGAIREAQRQLILCEADARRNECKAIIKSMAEFDICIQKFKYYYDKLRPSLSAEANVRIEREIQSMESRKNKLAFEKKRLSFPRQIN